jgi:hypothetical protein
MMLRRNSLLAIAVMSVGTIQTTAAEPDGWTITVAPYTGAVRTIFIPPPAASAPILLDQNASAASPVDATARGNSDDSPLIRPDDAGSVVHASASSHGNAKSVVDPAEYRRVYASIPFSRAEYDAYPGYRHEATMELLLGQLRPRFFSPSRTRPSIRVNVGWPQPFYLRNRDDRGSSRYPWH